MNILITTCFFHIDEILENQFDNHLLVEMVLRMDELSIMYSFVFFEEYIFFNVISHYVREIYFLRIVYVDFDEKKGEAR